MLDSRLRSNVPFTTKILTQPWHIAAANEVDLLGVQELYYNILTLTGNPDETVGCVGLPRFKD